MDRTIRVAHRTSAVTTWRPGYTVRQCEASQPWVQTMILYPTAHLGHLSVYNISTRISNVVIRVGHHRENRGVIESRCYSDIGNLLLLDVSTPRRSRRAWLLTRNTNRAKTCANFVVNCSAVDARHARLVGTPQFVPR